MLLVSEKVSLTTEILRKADCVSWMATIAQL